MSLLSLFSKRQRAIRGEVPDVYTYDILPQRLRVQVVHIIRDAIGEDRGTGHTSEVYTSVNDALCREYGVFELVQGARSPDEAVLNFFLQEESIEKALDVIELCFQMISSLRGDTTYLYFTNRKLEADAAIDELNQRFKESAVGFQFESNEVMRVDSTFLHAEAVKPALLVLQDEEFKGANEEFLGAHEHYRHGRYKESLVDALKSLESTIKVICKRRGWALQATDSAKQLIAVCFARGLLPSYLESQFGALRSLLESGTPTIRNKAGGHGQGLKPTTVPKYLAGYALHLSASSILFLIEAEAATR